LTCSLSIDINDFMYIKRVVKQNAGSKKKYEYLHLVESVRTNKGPRQRLILNLGNPHIPKDKFKELAKCIEAILSGQMQLFCFDPIIEKHAKKAARSILEKQSRDDAIDKISDAYNQPEDPHYQNIDINSFDAESPRTIGPEYVCLCIWKKLGISEVLLSNGIPESKIAIIQALVIGRLVDPGSERYTRSWAEERSAIYELTGIPSIRSLKAYYRCGDMFLECKQALEKHLSAREKDLFDLPEKMCFFDLTNTYLENQALANAKPKRGRSKEKRSDCKLLTLALIIDEQGFPKYSHLYSGNQSECKTLENMINSLTSMRPDIAKQGQTVIMDAGIATRENIEFLKQKKIHYIVVNRGKGEFTPDDTSDMRVIFKDEDRDFKVEIKSRREKEETWLLCRSTGRQQKDKGIHDRQELLFLEELQTTRTGLKKKGYTKKYNKIFEKIGRLRQKYPKVSKVFEINVTPEEEKVNSKTKAKDIQWTKKDQYDVQKKFEGSYVLRTDRVELSDEEVWKTYIMLTRIERAFRCMKTSLGLRPVFHQLEFRSDSHLFVSVIAYHILHIIETSLRMHGDHRSWKTIRNILSTHQRLTINYEYKENEKTQHGYIRLCSLPETEHKIIYHRLGLSDLPLGRRYKIENL